MSIMLPVNKAYSTTINRTIHIVRTTDVLNDTKQCLCNALFCNDNFDYHLGHGTHYCRAQILANYVHITYLHIG